MIATIDVYIQSAKPDFPLATFKAFVNSPSSVRIRNVPRKIGKWDLTSVQVTANYPDNSSQSVSAVLTAGIWVATLPASTATGTSLNGYTITANGTDENGNAVSGYILGKGDVVILNADGTITVGETTYYVHLVDTEPQTPKKGDLCVIGGVYKIYNGTVWTALGSAATIDWLQVTNKPQTFSPSAHASAHAANGTDAVTPAAIGAIKAPAGGNTGDVLTKTSDGVAWAQGGGGTGDYEDLTNKPQIGGVTLSGNKTAADLGLVATNDPRMTNARTPTAHASTHATGQSDEILPTDIGAANETHSHEQSDVTGLSGALAAKRDKTDYVVGWLASGEHPTLDGQPRFVADPDEDHWLWHISNTKEDAYAVGDASDTQLTFSYITVEEGEEVEKFFDAHIDTIVKASELPTQLPNPQVLTITKVAADGSTTTDSYRGNVAKSLTVVTAHQDISGKVDASTMTSALAQKRDLTDLKVSGNGVWRSPTINQYQGFGRKFNLHYSVDQDGYFYRGVADAGGGTIVRYWVWKDQNRTAWSTEAEAKAATTGYVFSGTTPVEGATHTPNVEFVIDTDLALTNGQPSAKVTDLFAKSDSFSTDHNLKNSKLQESVNALVDYDLANTVTTSMTGAAGSVVGRIAAVESSIGTINSALDALNGEVV